MAYVVMTMLHSIIDFSCSYMKNCGFSNVYAERVTQVESCTLVSSLERAEELISELKKASAAKSKKRIQYDVELRSMYEEEVSKLPPLTPVIGRRKPKTKGQWEQFNRSRDEARKREEDICNLYAKCEASMKEKYPDYDDVSQHERKQSRTFELHELREDAAQ